MKYFELISSKSDLYLRSKYFEGVINTERGKLKSAVKDFRDVYTSEAAPENPKDLEELEELKDLALINIARVYYKIEKFENADNYYSQVDRDSRYWAESLFERAWTAFLRKDSNLTLGLLLTVRSPYYSDQEYIPEGTVLRALTLYELCEFKDSERILLDFEGKYQPVREEIKAFVAEYESEEGQKLADRAFDTYFHGDKTDSQLQKNLFLKILRNRDMASVVKTLDMMDEEEALIDQQKGVWRDTVGNHLKQAIDEDRERYKRRGGLVLLKTLANENHKLGDLMQQSQIIRFEIVDAQRAEFERKMTNPDVGTIEGPPIDFAVSKQIIYWPFNGEFWQDELGYYRYTERGSCNN